MLHVYICKTCKTQFDGYCFEHLNYTEAGWETRKRQMSANQCIPCFGEIPELKQEQTMVPCWNPRTGNVESKTSAATIDTP